MLRLKTTKTKKTRTGRGGAPKGNRNAAKMGSDLRLEMYLSKVKRGFFEEFFSLKYGRPPHHEEELRELFRQIAYSALDRAMVEEFERHGRTGGEVY
jgi:hypothetical protein